MVRQPDTSWALERISAARDPGTGLQRPLTDRDPRLPVFNYLYDAGVTGKGTITYLVDSGVMCNHMQFEGRTVCYRRADFTKRLPAGMRFGAPSDQLGHGTAVAGVIGGKQWGVSKGTTIVSVKVIGKKLRFRASRVIAAMNWIVKHVQSTGEANSVVALTFVTPRNPAIEYAVDTLIQSKLVVVAAAGSHQRDICDMTPVNNPAVITVAGTTTDDKWWGNNNFGKCIDMLAPSQRVYTAYIGSPSTSGLLSNGPLAAGLVAGTAAVWLSSPKMQRKMLLPSDTMKYWMIQAALKDIINGVPLDTRNNFLNTLVPRDFSSPSSSGRSSSRQVADSSGG
ncbi:proteinase B [Savitreella phatthalungensis]